MTAARFAAPPALTTLTGALGRALGMAFTVALAAGLMVGCGAEPSGGESAGDPEGSGVAQVSFALKADVVSAGCPVSLSYPDVRSMRLRLFDGTPDNPDGTSPLFDSSSKSFAPDGCLSFVQCSGGSVRMDANDGQSQADKAAQCEAGGGVLVAARSLDVVDIATGTGITAYLEVFSDANCEQRAFVALRGGIDIVKNAKPSFSLIPLCTGHFTELPNPSHDNPTFSRAVATTTCTGDCDCLDAFADTPGVRACSEQERANGSVSGAPLQCKSGRCTRGYAFEALLATTCESDEVCTAIYAEARCDAEVGFCAVDSYFPLEPAAPRAFHSSTALADGHVALVGGLSASTNAGLVAEPNAVELFDPMTFTFSKAKYQDSAADSFETDDLGRAFHSSILADGGGSLVTVGGLRSIDIRVQDSGKGAGRQLVLGPTSGLGDKANYRSDLVLLDVTNPTTATRGRSVTLDVTSSVGEVQKTLSQPYAGAIAEVVDNGGKVEFFFAGGFAPSGSPGTQGANDEETAPFANLVVNCVFAGSLGASCLVNPSVLSVARAAAAGVCLSSNANGVCEAFGLVGGARQSGAPTAEIFQVPEEGRGGFVAMESDGAGDLRRAKFVRTASFPSDGVAFTFGGANVELFGGPANVPTYAVSADVSDPETPTLVAQEVDASQAPGGESATYRSHHAVSTLSRSRILVTGGLDDANLPTAQALLFDTESQSYTDQLLSMNRARFGHQATVIARGPLAGAVLVTGGLELASDGRGRIVRVAEIYVPE